MKIKQPAIKKYKLNQWASIGESKIIYGIDVVMDNGNCYHCLEDSKTPIFITDKKEAVERIKKLNQELP